MSYAWNKLPPIRVASPVLSLAVGPGGLWAGGHGGVAWLPTAGAWQPQLAGLPLTSIAALAYAGGWLLAGGAEGIARSSNGGRDWQLAHIQGETGGVAALVCSPRFSEDTTALAATLAGGVVRTTDAGAHWRPATFGMQSSEAVALAWGAGETVFAATADGVYRSPNAGRAWRLCEPTEDAPISAIAVLPDATVIAAVERGGLIYSRDCGENWTHYTVPPDIELTALLATPKSLLLGTIHHGILQSTNDGETWQRVGEGIVLAFAAGQCELYAGTMTGACGSADGSQSWQPLPTPPLHDLRRFVSTKDMLLIAGVNAPPVHYTSAKSWIELKAVPLPLAGLAAAPDGALIASSPDGLFRSSDNGQSWHTVIPGEAGCVAQFTFRGDGTGWAGSADASRLLRTGNAGRSWQPLESPFGVLPLAALQATADSLFAATFDPRRQIAQLWRSDDDGSHWQRGAEVGTRWPIVATHSQPPLLTLGGTILVQTTEGAWEQVSLGGAGVRRVLGDQSGLLALAEDGVFSSLDSGKTWSRDGTGLPLDQVIDLAQHNGELYALLAGGEVWVAE